MEIKDSHVDVRKEIMIVYTVILKSISRLTENSVSVRNDEI